MKASGMLLIGCAIARMASQARDKYYAPVVVVISVNDRFNGKADQSSSRR